MDDYLKYMEESFLKSEYAFSQTQLRQFYTFYQLMIERNKVVNLTGITDFKEVVQKHFIDSLSLNRVVFIENKIKIIDIGTGAGFPGIPLKIAYPELEIVLMDSLNKRIKFINEVIEILELSNIKAIHARAEELARMKEHREVYDVCVSRAVANLAALEEYCLPFVKIGGKFISYKSGEVEEEVLMSKRACHLLGGKTEEVHHFSLEEGTVQRSFVVVEKIKKTPGTYPRKAGTPAKTPLL